MTEAKSSGSSRPGKLKNKEISAELRDTPGWKGRDRRSSIQRTYQFPSFRAALAFVCFVGELAEDRAHHPDIDIRYNRVTLTLSTHDAGGLTRFDFELARLIDQ